MLRNKECSRCKQTKSVLEFHKSKSSKDGYKSWCKECRKLETKKYREQNKEALNAKKKQWYKDTKKIAKIRTDSELKLGKKTCNQCNIEKVVTDFRERSNGGFYSICKNCENANNKTYRKENRDIVNRCKTLTENRRRSAKRKLKSDFTVKEWEFCKAEFGGKCAYCGKSSKQLCQDHFFPLSKGGEYTKRNIIPSCRSCNSRKGNKTFSEWYNNDKSYSRKREQTIINYLQKL